MTKKVHAVSSIMGSGKTTWAIDYMNKNKDRRFIYCTPFIDEISRIIEVCPQFKQPDSKNDYTKMSSFLKLLKDGENIALTHALFESIQITGSILKLIQEGDYILVLDEVIDVVEKVQATKHDIDEIQKYTRIDEATKRLIWTERNYAGNHERLMKQIKSKTVYQYKDNLLLWLFPAELFAAFDEIYVLTFLFEGSYLEQYLKIHGYDYDFNYVRDGALCSGNEPLGMKKRKIRELLSIYHGKMNEVGEKTSSMSATWWRNKNGRDLRSKAYNDAYNYIRNVSNAASEELIWTVFKGKTGKDPSIKGRFKTRFCACNARATNIWKDSSVLVYLVNMYPDPSVIEWFRENGGSIDETQYALSAMLQWIWRSAIRDGKPVKLYIPSRRMRHMLEKWLEAGENEEFGSDEA